MDTAIKYSEDGSTRYVTNIESGEILHEHKKQEVWVQDGEQVYVHKPKKAKARKKTIHFIKLHRINWRGIIRNNLLTTPELALLTSLLAFLDWESNYIIDDETKQPFNESSLAKAIHCDRRNLHTLLKSLERKGFLLIEKQGRGKPNRFLLNPNIAVFGECVKDATEHDKFNDVEYRPKSPIKP
ncbi:hypothetical protein CPJCM30710_27810 [Clostridium polyendosporum]|uniref:Uncharacterized protein n=1 Tax=Clostridium polyendosporum TaxID=69208 RepID=A0A919S2M6_9CLOT|nr:hypothetical protein [Clostridium polyendosporum]GIM30115.1 hypothetical protein CPJCM30710_27810 [Clostridium polyendosporum]